MGIGDNKRPRSVKPVIKVELSEKNKGLRIAAVILLIVIAAVAFTVVVRDLLGHNEGWQTITPKEDVFGFTDEIAISYDLGRSGLTVMEENNLISELYTDVAKRMIKLFESEKEYADVSNLAYISNHPGIEITVDPVLYDALALITEGGSRRIYQKPITDAYRMLFGCENEIIAKDYDPYYNSDVAAKFDEINSYILNDEHIRLELLDDNKIILYVSDEYASYAEANGQVGYLDFGIFRNAFFVDALADELIEKGYTYGSVVSFDGFSRSLDTRNVEYALNINDIYEGHLYTAASFKFTGRIATVQFRNYPMNSSEFMHYFMYEDGSAHLYISETDGKYRSAIDTLYAYSTDLGCAQIALSASELYIRDSIDYELVDELKYWGIDIVFADDDAKVKYTEEQGNIGDLYESEDVKYLKEFID